MSLPIDAESALEGRGARLPLVSCIMPTADRRPFIPQAINGFLKQDYPGRELIVIDDGADSIADLIPSDPRIRYMRLNQRLSVGAKRNTACRQAHGELIAHWDDDDWMAPWRLSYQVDALLSEEADVCGLDRVLFWEPESDTAWRYVYPRTEPPWLAGGTLLYRHELWCRRPFVDANVGEDNAFIWDDEPKRIAHLDREDFYVAVIHRGNTSPKIVEPIRWHEIEAARVHSLLGESVEAHRSLIGSRRGGAIRSNNPSTTVSLSGRPDASERPEGHSKTATSEAAVVPFTIARREHLELTELRAFNAAYDVPWMRRWELPFALHQARLTEMASVLDCTINPVGMERAIAELFPNVRYRHWSPVIQGVFQTPFAVPDGVFDRVFCINTLEHLLAGQRDELLAALVTKLRPGGWLLATVDYCFESSRKKREWLDSGLISSDGRERFEGLNRLSPRDLEALCRRHGLEAQSPAPEEPQEGDEGLYYNPPPLVHTSFGGVFYKPPLEEPAAKKVLLAMLTWNTCQVSVESLDALAREARMLRRLGHDAEIIVVDNGSTDGTPEQLRTLDALIDVPHRFILNPCNIGNSRGRNQMIDHLLAGNGDYLLFTDGDLELVPGSSYAMLRYLEGCGRKVGCVGAYSFDFTPDRAKATPALHSLARCAFHASDILAWTQYGMFRREVFADGVRFEDSGPFGEPGHGLEDVDLAWQMGRLGFLNHYFKGIRYLHRNLSSSVGILKAQGLDPFEIYYRRRDFLHRKWSAVPGVSADVMNWLRSAQAPYSEEAGERKTKVRFGPRSCEVLVPAQVREWIERSVSDMLDATELEAIAAALASFPWSNGEIVVEIGAYLGTTTVMMAKVLETLGRSAKILSIDPFERSEPENLNARGDYGRYIEAIRACAVEDRCFALAAFSADVACIVPNHVGLLSIDGSHRYPAIQSDLALYCPKVVSGGFIYIDDYKPAYPDVIRAVDEYLADHPELEVEAKEHYVVLRVPERR